MLGYLPLKFLSKKYRMSARKVTHPLEAGGGGPEGQQTPLRLRPRPPLALPRRGWGGGGRQGDRAALHLLTSFLSFCGLQLCRRRRRGQGRRGQGMSHGGFRRAPAAWRRAAEGRKGAHERGRGHRGWAGNCYAGRWGKGRGKVGW